MNINYNQKLDILVVEKQSYENYSQSLEQQGFVLDLDSESNFLGLEIIDVSQKISLTKDELSNIEKAEVEIEKEEESIKASLKIHIGSEKTVITSQHPIATA